MDRKRLIEARLEKDLTQKELAFALDISTVYVRKIEKGEKNPGRDTLFKYVSFFNEDAKNLFPDLFLNNIDTKCIETI